MTFYDIFQFLCALISLFLGFFLFSILANLFKYKFWQYFFWVCKDIVIVSFIVSFIIIFIPFQFKHNLITVLLLIYLLLFRVFGPSRIQKKLALSKKWKIKRFIHPRESWIVILFIVGVVVFMGRWYITMGAGMKSVNESKSLLINSSGDIVYDYDDTASYAVWLSDTNQDGNYDTVKFDINKDGIVDILHKDTNQDLVIDRIEVVEYSTQILEIYIFLLFCMIAIIIWWIKKKNLKWQLKDKGVSKEEDLQMPKDRPEDYKELKKKANQKLGEEIKKEKKLKEEKEFDLDLKNLTFSKLFSEVLIGILLFFNIFSPVVLAISQDEIKFQMWEHKDCAKSPFDDNKCKWVSLEIRRYMQYIICDNKFKEKARERGDKLETLWLYWKELDYQKALVEYQTWWNKWKSTTPSDCKFTKKTSNYDNWVNKRALSILQKKQNFSWYGRDRFYNLEIKNIYEKIEKENNVDIDYFKMLDEIWKYQKVSTIVSSKLLKGINWLKKPKLTAVAFSKEIYVERDQKSLMKVLKILDKWKNNQIIVDSLFSKMSIDFRKLQKEKSQNFRLYMDKVGVEAIKFEKTLKLISIYNDWLNIYSNTKEFDGLLKWDLWNTFEAVGLITIWEWIFWSNPIDIITNLIDWWFSLAGETKLGETIWSISARKIVKKTVKDAFITTNNDFEAIFIYEKQKYKNAWKDNQYNLLRKIIIQLDSMRIIFYRWIVWGIQNTLEIQKKGSIIIYNGTKKIVKWMR